MPETSQSPIDPFGPSEQSPTGDMLIHMLKASRSCCSDFGLNAEVIKVRLGVADRDAVRFTGLNEQTHPHTNTHTHTHTRN